MCIICRCGCNPDAQYHAEHFLDHYRRSQEEMRLAAENLATLSRIVPADRKRYDRVHKHMKRVMREWNQIEHEREIDAIHD